MLYTTSDLTRSSKTKLMEVAKEYFPDVKVQPNSDGTITFENIELRAALTLIELEEKYFNEHGSINHHLVNKGTA